MKPALALTRCLASFFLTLLPLSAVAQEQTPPPTKFFSTAAEESYSTYQMAGGDGDLWPSCWASDDNVYAANGDGSAFTGGATRFDMAVSRIAGTPPHLTGTTVATDVGTNWSGAAYNRKPTGMLCANGVIYLAFQNLNSTTFGDAPAASIAMSSDGGATWSWDKSKPMFGTPGNNDKAKAYEFTTIFFLDYGKNSEHAIDNYVYAYGLDNNWREQQTMFLARVPVGRVQDRSAWEFYAGTDHDLPTWDKNIQKKAPVLTDTRLLYPVMFGTDCPAKQPVIGQGGVVYDAPLHRYLFTSWSCATHEIYEAPEPWGPWKHVLSKDFGPLRLVQNRGQYGTSIPSKFISEDGKTAWLQSNVCCGGDSYTFSLRKVHLEPFTPSLPANPPSTYNLGTAPHARGISKSTHFGTLCDKGCTDQLSSGLANVSEDDFDEEDKTSDWWGYLWPRAYRMNQVVYRTGSMFPDGGWYASDLRVQVRQDFKWVDVSSNISPVYPYASAGAQTTYTFTFPNTWGDGVRIIGTPGGASHFTSINQLGVCFTAPGTSCDVPANTPANLVADPGFELQTGPGIAPPWGTEGPDAHGIDVGLGFAHSGQNEAWIRDASFNWNSIIQTIAVQPKTDYTLTAWVRNNFGTNLGYFGVRGAGGAILQEIPFGSAPNYTQLSLTFNSGTNSSVTFYTGFWGQGTDTFIQLDDVSLK